MSRKELLEMSQKLSKKQLEIVGQLQDGAFVWQAGATTYLASKDSDTGQVTSKVLHKKRFDSLVAAGVLTKNSTNPKQWVLANHLRPEPLAEA